MTGSWRSAATLAKSVPGRRRIAKRARRRRLVVRLLGVHVTNVEPRRAGEAAEHLRQLVVADVPRTALEELLIAALVDEVAGALGRRVRDENRHVKVGGRPVQHRADLCPVVAPPLLPVALAIVRPPVSGSLSPP